MFKSGLNLICADGGHIVRTVALLLLPPPPPPGVLPAVAHHEGCHLKSSAAMSF
jgi:hypothetical protein